MSILNNIFFNMSTKAHQHCRSYLQQDPIFNKSTQAQGIRQCRCLAVSKIELIISIFSSQFVTAMTTTRNKTKTQKPSPIKKKKSSATVVSPASVASFPKPAGISPKSAGISAGISTISKAGLKPPPLKGGLQAFGIKPGARVKFSDRNATLKCCVIKGPEENAIVFRVNPNDPHSPNGCWLEKVFFDAIRSESEWVTELHFDSQALQWYHGNVPQKNSKDYLLRLFVIRTTGNLPPKENLVKLGQRVCDNINATPSNKTTISVDEESYFWLPNGAVWSDIIGNDAAFAALTKAKGDPFPGFYDLHKDTIHSYFRPKTFSLELARAFHAPLDEVHPALREKLSEAINCEDNDDDETCDEDAVNDDASDEAEMLLEDTDVDE